MYCIMWRILCVCAFFFLVSSGGEGRSRVSVPIYFPYFFLFLSHGFLCYFRYIAALYIFFFPSVQDDVATRLTNTPRVNRQ